MPRFDETLPMLPVPCHLEEFFNSTQLNDIFVVSQISSLLSFLIDTIVIRIVPHE